MLPSACVYLLPGVHLLTSPQGSITCSISGRGWWILILGGEWEGGCVATCTTTWPLVCRHVHHIPRTEVIDIHTHCPRYNLLLLAFIDTWVCDCYKYTLVSHTFIISSECITNPLVYPSDCTSCCSRCQVCYKVCFLWFRTIGDCLLLLLLLF